MKKLVFVVEDEQAIRELYVYALEGAGLAVECFENQAELYLALENQTPDLFILDIMLGSEDGFDILKNLKQDPKYANTPTIMVSAKNEELSKVKGLNLGADDYISKPFGVLELIARINANLRKSQNNSNTNPPKELSFQDISIDFNSHCVNVNSCEVKLTLKEFKLLKLFCKNPNRVISREEMFADVWGDEFLGETRTLDMHIKELRKKLHDSNSQATIKTVRGVGYIIK